MFAEIKTITMTTKKRPVGRPKKAKNERKTFVRFGIKAKHEKAFVEEVTEIMKKYE